VRPYLAWSPWPRDIFYFDVIPREMSWTSMLTFWAGGIIVSFAASLIPAFRAARTNPVKTLRYE
jgi:lipoprotein-releasing system permease protein